MFNGNIEVRLYLPDEGLSQDESKRISRDLDLISSIAFMRKTSPNCERGLRRVYAVHHKGKFTGYRIEDIELLRDKFDPTHLYAYSEGLSRREITLGQIDKIESKLKELRQNPF